MERVTDWIREGDVKTFFWVNRSWKCFLTDLLMSIVTLMGGAIWCIGFTLVLLLSDHAFWHQVGVHLSICLSISHLIVRFCKKIFPRPRPYKVLDNVFTGRWLLQDASFPSGHATASFCMATILSEVFPAYNYLFYGLAAFVSFSRVYLGLHYPTDIVFGAILGTTTARLLG
ncbi:phosphatase PAP2 family protein [Collibacillus ludicampi]|uniref:Phosphatase PAP2 family protein n=1 Tax=Collibacillus ludicampi TaxID=2771369 RepID=A0AAV4LK32_9BACL|nr:phosphatase PAP2 family protein [Collibacillus ludicampi]GIM48091.1 phosphatase PAP2 family protein [Collibacillus ludicampi]